MPPKVYIETSVISYLTSKPSRDVIALVRQHITREWWDKRRSDFDLYVSELVEQEASGGDASAAAQRLSVINLLPKLEVNQQAVALAQAFIAQKIFPQKAKADALHIAIATVHQMNYLLSWNFRHIVNAATRIPIVQICQMNGYEPPAICTPEELMRSDNDGK